ncbi:MAG: DUF3365 domain-containing protein [Bacteroidales bacterium]|nr:DUF3365 domain-containing protein [Bacteroidales bacterium]
MRKMHLLWFVLSWTALIIASFLWSRSLIIKNNRVVVQKKAQSFFDHIVTTRSWNSEHGGVYVPVTESTQPNPYLEDTLRDIVTLNGLKLTKINPAYMTRQISEINKDRLGIHFHITSLHPIRPANKPDEWETGALKLFESNTPELLEVVGNNYRYMAPLYTEKSCLRCHYFQGYNVGDIRGGISVSFPATFYLKNMNKQIITLGFIHLIVLGIGIAGLLFYFRMSNRYVMVIENKNDELKRINVTKDKFFSIIAHDLRSPLSALTSLGQTLLESHNEIPVEQREELINILYDGSKKTYNLLDNLLKWATSESGRLSFNPVQLPINDIIKDNLILLEENFKNKKISVNYDLNEIVIVYADLNMLNTILRNLLSNAIKYSRLNGTVKVSAKKITGGMVEISIADTGIGIEEELRTKIFDTDNITTKKGTSNEIGTGLGLKLSKEFVEKNGGQIWVESEPGKGSVFSFTLPESGIQ